MIEIYEQMSLITLRHYTALFQYRELNILVTCCILHVRPQLFIAHISLTLSP